MSLTTEEMGLLASLQAVHQGKNPDAAPLTQDLVKGEYATVDEGRSPQMPALTDKGRSRLAELQRKNDDGGKSSLAADQSQKPRKRPKLPAPSKKPKTPKPPKPKAPGMK